MSPVDSVVGPLDSFISYYPRRLSGCAGVQGSKMFYNLRDTIMKQGDLKEGLIDIHLLVRIEPTDGVGYPAKYWRPRTIQARHWAGPIV